MSFDVCYGYTGKLLRIDLSKEEVSVEEIKPEILRKFIGGVGYGAKLLYDELPAGIDPLSPENKIAFVTGPLTGTGAPGSGSVEACFKSPLTGIWAEARSGGEWGGALRKAGYDFLVIEGKAKEPKYIVIDDGKVEIRPAVKLQGKTTSEKGKLVKEELSSDKFEIVTIGPAGENLVRFANIMAGECAFGRCGGGAVMGSKNLLAVAVKGSGQIPIANPPEFSSACKEYYQKVLESTGKAGMSEGGTTMLMVGCDFLGVIPTKNWRSNSWGKGEELYAHFKRKNLVRAEPCYKGCVLRCKRIAGVESGKWKTPIHKGSEYESIASFTFFAMNDDMDAAVHADYLCNEYGIDSISTGSAIAFAMDCYDEGIITREEADGLDLTWGNTETMIALIKKIANREGIGRVLSEGVRRASQQIGKGADKLAIEVKGLEGAAHDPRAAKSQAVLYGTNNRGMCHMHPNEGTLFDAHKVDFGLVPYGLPDPHTVDRFSEKGRGKIVKGLQDCGITADILGICRFYLFEGLEPGDLARMMAALTGWSIDGKELLDAGERVSNLQRMFNTREGIRKADDMLPERCLKRPEFGKYSSVAECEIKNYEQMLEEYYEARGWDKKTGVPMET
ncbi:MAG: aldehyde ferredoxin oxidoreductase family protein [Desulfobacteraceae bacterium]|nr:aldehyde ferredoxin oxidoreductase family protein [Desulfobacteraceae bacterium]